MNVYLLAKAATHPKERVKKAFYVKSHKCQSKGLFNHCFSVSTFLPFLAYFLHVVSLQLCCWSSKTKTVKCSDFQLVSL